MTLDRLAPAIFVLLWSTGWVVAKYAGLFADPLTFLVLRYAIAVTLFLIFCLATGAQWPRTRGEAGHAVISGMFLHGLYLASVWWAIGQGVPAALSGIIAGLQPLMTAAVAPALIGERLSGQQRLGLSIGFLGIAIAVLPKILAIDTGATPILPVIVNVLGMAAATYGTIHQKRFLQAVDIRSIATLQYVGALIVTIPLALMLEDLHVTWSFELFAALAWSVLALSMGAIALLLYLIRRGQVSRAASLIYLVPPLAAVQAMILFGETLTTPMIIGTVVAVTGVYLTNRTPGPIAP
ncbi:DMT family transporter [Pararhizobium antarcticum]|uniref:Peptide ABC transporter ATP-binding protein n=1 Tax=Pararhizobium antarcticum TaxID=1798805 RepID=A0A657LS87_9HYPH|nr:DMT family transporter [Pararhizobium antarcticum]OJF95545.1 peptide ABC transporter ATP-binding protein [Rhizobium sp. 58]OJF96893.1 peptide ABC transporter ATP-binding protein [Pararhizobium antarcticum]